MVRVYLDSSNTGNVIDLIIIIRLWDNDVYVGGIALIDDVICLSTGAGVGDWEGNYFQE